MKILLFVSLMLVSACGSQSSPQSQQDSKEALSLIEKVLPSPTTIFHVGDSVEISYTLPKDIESLDSVKIMVNNSIIDGNHYFIAPNHRVGRLSYKIQGYKNGESATKVGEFIVLPKKAPLKYGYKVINTYPHDTRAYTQGLQLEDGIMYEGTGLNGKSSLRKVELATGNILKKIDIGEEFFGEGIVLINNRIYQLTWTSGRGFIYDSETFEKLSEFGYPGEGWGITTDGTMLYMSDGSERIYVINPERFERIRTIEVYDNRGKVVHLNEMEWIDGEIWANVYMTDNIVRIDPESGAVVGVVDLSGLLKPSDIQDDTDVLNGIAYDKKSKKIYVTGKNWNKLFQINLDSF